MLSPHHHASASSNPFSNYSSAILDIESLPGSAYRLSSWIHVRAWRQPLFIKDLTLLPTLAENKSYERLIMALASTTSALKYLQSANCDHFS